MQPGSLGDHGSAAEHETRAESRLVPGFSWAPARVTSQLAGRLRDAANLNATWHRRQRRETRMDERISYETGLVRAHRVGGPARGFRLFGDPSRGRRCSLLSGALDDALLSTLLRVHQEHWAGRSSTCRGLGRGRPGHLCQARADVRREPTGSASGPCLNEPVSSASSAFGKTGSIVAVEHGFFFVSGGAVCFADVKLGSGLVLGPGT